MNNQKFVRIINEERYLDMSLDVIEKYPNTPFYSYFKEFPTNNVFFNDICTSLDFHINFEEFITMYDYVSNKYHYLDAPDNIKNLMDKFNFIDPTLISVANQIENNKKNLYAGILKSLKQLYDRFDIFISKKNTLLTMNFDEYQMYKDALSTNPNIIPVQIILNHKRFVTELTTIREIEKRPYFIQCINIYDGLPLYHASQFIDEPDIFFLENEYTRSVQYDSHPFQGIDRNMVREQMFNVCDQSYFSSEIRTKISDKAIDFSFITLWSKHETATEIDLAQNWYSDDIITYIDTYLNVNTFTRYFHYDLFKRASEKYLNNDNIIHFYGSDVKQMFRNIYIIISQDPYLMQQMKSCITPVIFGFVQLGNGTQKI